MAGTRQVCRLGFGVDRHMNRGGTVRRRNPGRDVFAGVDRDREGCAKHRSIFDCLLGQVQFFDALGSQCQTDQSAGMPGHEIDGLRGHLFCGNDEVAFVFPVFVVDQDDEFPLLNVADGVFDIVERLRHR